LLPLKKALLEKDVASLTGRVRNEVLREVKEDRNVVIQKNKRMANWVGHI
jgi:hypothetical protein